MRSGGRAHRRFGRRRVRSLPPCRLAVLVADVPECARRIGDLAVAVRAILDLDVVDALGPGAPVGEELGQVVREAGVDAALMLAPRLDAAALVVVAEEED